MTIRKVWRALATVTVTVALMPSCASEEATDGDAEQVTGGVSDGDAPETSDGDAPETSDGDAPETSDGDAPETSDGVTTRPPGNDKAGDLAEEGGADATTYCQAARELDEQQSFPTAEQLDGLVAVTPDDIKSDIQFVVDRFKQGITAGDPGEIFGDPDFQKRLESIEAFESRECGLR